MQVEQLLGIYKSALANSVLGDSNSAEAFHRNVGSTSVVVPTFRRPQQLELLLNSLFSGTVVPDEVVVVDNDPQPSCVPHWPSAWPVRVIHAGLGLNLAGARNAGWRAAKSDVCIFLDDDNVVGETTLAHLQCAATRSDVGLAAPVIYDAGRPELVWCAGTYRSKWTTRTRFLYRGSALPAANAWPTEDMPDAFAIPRRILDLVGGFDEQTFPFHYDEADICERIRGRGYRAIVVREARVWHSGGTASDAGAEAIRAFQISGPRRVSLMTRARVLFHKKHSRGVQRLVAVGVFAPIYAALVSVACLRQPGTLSLKLRVSRAVFEGLAEGFAK
jgi:GT2 family glycosyltransferase